MTLERHVEGRSTILYRAVGAEDIKLGFDGLPDRLVLWGGGRHFWVEYKMEKTGRLRPAQAIWKKYLEEGGDRVYVVDTVAQTQDIITEWYSSYGRATAHRR